MKCCICGQSAGQWGNNPWPVDKTDGARCCDACNSIYVIPKRLEEMFSNGKKSEECDEINKCCK